MGRLFIDGFESGGIDLWDGASGGPAVATGITGMDGTYCLNMNANQPWLYKALAAKSELYVAFRWRPVSGADHTSIFNFTNGGTILGKLRRNKTSGLWEAYRYTTLIATGTTVTKLNETHVIEIYYKPADAGGRFVVKMNSLTEIDFTGDTTDGATTIDGIRVGFDGLVFVNSYFDNIVIDDAAWIGNTLIQAIVPNAPGNSTQWTPSAGANWQCVDEIPASDADYNSLNAVDQLDLYGASDLGGAVAVIKCVQVQTRAVKEGAAVPQNVLLACRIGATNYFSSALPVPSSAKSLFKLWENSPATAAPWTVQEVTDLEIGIKSAT